MAEDDVNFYRLIGFLVSICPEIFREYFLNKCFPRIGVTSFEEYLTKMKHAICHLVRPGKCCKCLSKECKDTNEGKQKTNKEKPDFDKSLTDEQLKLLFDYDGDNSCEHAEVIKNAKVKPTRFCICKYSAKKNLTLEKVLDVTLTHCLLKNCEPKDNSRENWTIQIKNIRNKVAHKTDTKSTTDVEFESLWNTLDGCSRGLASQISDGYEKSVIKKISELKTMRITRDDKMKELHILWGWWLEKLLEFGKMEQMHFNATSKKLNTMKKEFSKVAKKVDNMDSKLDKLFITFEGNGPAYKLFSATSKEDPNHITTNNKGKKTIPVLMCLETPETWDTAQLIQGIRSIQNLLNNVGGDLKITSFSTEEVTLFMDVASYLFVQPSKFQEEIKQLLNNIVKESRVDTTVIGEMNAKISIEEDKVIPRIDIKGQTEYTVECGTPITVHCDIYSDPQITEVYWEREDSSGKVRIQTDSVQYDGSSSKVPSLTFLDPMKSDAGEYTCVVTNIVGTVRSERVTLTVTGDIPDIKSAGFCDVEYGRNTSVKCTINSRPVLTDVYWEVITGIEGRTTYENQARKYKGKSSANVSLEVKCVTMTNKGRYFCHATNKVGRKRSEPILLTVNTENQADVHFLLDASGSVHANDFTTQKQFVKDFAGKFKIGQFDFQIGLSTFANDINPQFFMNQHSKMDSLLAAIDMVRYDGGGTCTYQALEWAGKNAFCEATNQREGVKKFIILLTDGESSNSDFTLDQARILHRKQINVMVLGIAGRKCTEWDSIASDPKFVFHTTHFYTLGSILPSVTNSMKQELSNKSAIKRSMSTDVAESSGSKKCKVSEKTYNCAAQ